MTILEVLVKFVFWEISLCALCIISNTPSSGDDCRIVINLPTFSTWTLDLLEES